MENMFEEAKVDDQASTVPAAPKRAFELKTDEVVYDDCFVIRETRYGLFTSYMLDGKSMITGLTLQAVLHGTRFNLKAEQDGTLWTGDNVRVMGSAVVGGKL